MKTRKVVHEESQLGKALNEIERILNENHIEVLVRGNKLVIMYDDTIIEIIDTYSKGNVYSLPRNFEEEKFIIMED